jgi:hypothetical protein
VPKGCPHGVLPPVVMRALVLDGREIVRNRVHTGVRISTDQSFGEIVAALEAATRRLTRNEWLRVKMIYRQALYPKSKDRLKVL